MSAQKNQEKMTVRILRDGRIVIDGSGLPPRRLRELQETLQETLGPAVILDETTGNSPEAPRLWSGLDFESDQQREQQSEKGSSSG